jgi:hypothetical protein
VAYAVYPVSPSLTLGGVSESGKIVKISISCVSDLVSLTPSLNVNIFLTNNA